LAHGGSSAVGRGRAGRRPDNDAVSRRRPATTHVFNTRGCKYSLYAPDDERKYRSKGVEQPRNNKLSYTVAYCWSFSYIIPCRHILTYVKPLRDSLVK
jgi:hypothetical protein